MNQLIDSWLMTINNIGAAFWSYAAGMFVQSGVLILSLLAFDFLLRKRVRAIFRYWIWMLVFIKLILPPTLSLPTGIGYWFGDHLFADSIVLEQPSETALPGPVAVPATKHRAMSAEIPLAQPSEIDLQPITPAAPAASSVPPITWRAMLFLLWLAGLSVISILVARRIGFVRRAIAQSASAEDRLLDVLNQCRREVGVRQDIQLRLSTGMPSPAVCGLFKPTILMPASLPNKLSPEKLRAVLIHELAHIKRGDLWINSAQTLLQIIYFYNPLVWLTNTVVRRIREQAVDEMVLFALGDGAGSYSNTLIDIAEMAFSRPRFSLGLVGVVESKKALHARVRHMLNRPIPKSAKVGVLGTLLIIVFAAVFLPMAEAQKKDSAFARTAQVSERFAATLPDGTTVELLGVCEHPSTDKQWWRPDGSIVKGEGFGDLHFKNPYYVPESNEQTRVFAIGLGGRVLKDIKMAWELTESLRSSWYSAHDDEYREILKPVQGLVAKFPREVQYVDLTVRIAAGGWKSVASGSNGRTEAGTNDSLMGRSVIFHRAVQQQDTVELGATHLLGNDYDCRIVVVDMENEVHEPKKRSNSGSDMRFCKGTFDLSPDQIKHIRLEARPYEWIEFKNVSLQRGVRPDVLRVPSDKYPTMRSAVNAAKNGDAIILNPSAKEKDAPGQEKPQVSTPKINHYEATLSGGVTVELVGICREPNEKGQQWWRPDGMEMEEPEYELRGKQSFKYPGFGYLLKFSPKEDLTYRSEINLEHLFMSSGPVTKKGQAVVRWGENQQLTEPLPNQADVIVDVAAGDWQVNGPGRYGVYDEFTNLPDKKVIIVSGLRPNPKEQAMVKTLIEATTTSLLVEVRLECITTDGKSHTSRNEGTLTQKNQLIQHTFGFTVPVEQIEKINVMHRPFHRVEFKDVSIKAGYETHVRVPVLSENGLPAEKRKALARSLRALESRRDRLTQTIDRDRQTMYQLGQEYGGLKTLEGRQQMMFQRVASLLNRLTTVQAERIHLEARVRLLERTEEQPMSRAELLQLRQDHINQDPAALALVPTIAQLEQELVVAKQTLSPMHPELRSKAENLEALKASLGELKQEAGRAFDRRPTKEAADAGNKQLVLHRNELEQKKTLEKILRAQIDKEDIETVRIGRKQLAIQELQDRLASVKERLDVVVGRIQDLKMQQDNPVVR